MEQKVEVVEKLPLLSNSFYKDLQSIVQINKCAIAKALVAAHEGRLPITDFCRMITACNVLYESQNVDTAESVTFSFLPKDKQPEYSENGKWSRKNRQTGKPAKIVQSLLELDLSPIEVAQLKINRIWHDYTKEVGLALIPGKAESMKFVSDTDVEKYETRCIKRANSTYTPKMYETFANNIKSYYECRFEFKIVEGDDLNKFYSSDYYYSKDGEKGTLWSSCMRDVPSDYFDFYSKNGVKLLIANYCDEIVGRALIWQTDKGVMMDRIYYYYDYLERLFISYAQENKWMHKTSQGSDNSLGVMVYDEKEGCYQDEKLRLEVTLTYKPDAYPYCDTFKYYNGSDLVTNDEDNKERYLLESTEGERILNKGIECVLCCDTFEEEDVHYVDRHGTYVCEDHGVLTIEDEWEYVRDCNQLYDDRWAYRTETVLMHNHTYALKRDTVTTYNRKIILKDESVLLLNGKIAWEGDPDIEEITEGDHKGKYTFENIKPLGDSFAKPPPTPVSDIISRYFDITELVVPRNGYVENYIDSFITNTI